ncbi:hypothetical protein C882_4449 [Caenispirillum salinarum AK4]|uniref:Uncharacterized protein n=1 Tax=Caenispirillum salinarum AK4 TaxID=1238182 RepID=K9GWX9_9PROT|nr:hypothetical protein [Caenispirillum salinarum]EKV30490.1 hypothetical protein C882_4449 [Caenispirillum salinarum AK4]
MTTALFILDICAALAALAAAWLWYAAGQRPQRRVSKEEDLDYQDFNRLATGINRSNLLNRRAALATAASSSLVALRLLVDAFI